MNLRQNIRAWRRYRNTVNELSRMSDHELRDIGVFRADIRIAARGGNN